MNKIRLSELSNAAQPEKIVVYSHGYHLYTLEMDIAGVRHLILDENNKAFRFSNIESIRQALKESKLPLDNCQLIQPAVYSEMIGLSSQPVPPMSLPLNWHHAHYDDI